MKNIIDILLKLDTSSINLLSSRFHVDTITQLASKLEKCARMDNNSSLVDKLRSRVAFLEQENEELKERIEELDDFIFRNNPTLWQELHGDDDDDY